MGTYEVNPLIDHINQYLKREGKSISQLARDANLATPTLSRFLKSERGLSAQNIRRLAAAAGERSDDWLLMAGIRENDSITSVSGLTKKQIDDEFPTTAHLPTDELELSDKIAQLTPANRAIVEGVVNLMLAQNRGSKKTHR